VEETELRSGILLDCDFIYGFRIHPQQTGLGAVRGVTLALDGKRVLLPSLVAKLVF
jgi:hypothetical protein